MTATLLRDIGHTLYGPSVRTWQGEMADALGVNLRTVQRWAIGEGEPSDGVWGELLDLLAEKKTAIAGLQFAVAEKIPAIGDCSRETTP